MYIFLGRASKWCDRLQGGRSVAAPLKSCLAESLNRWRRRTPEKKKGPNLWIRALNVVGSSGIEPLTPAV